jgi:hypothetical protein
MTKNTKTILLALGGLATLAAAGTAIYYATKKPALETGSKKSSGVPSDDGKPSTDGGAATTAPSAIADAMPLELQTFANWLSQHSKLIDPETLQNV